MSCEAIILDVKRFFETRFRRYGNDHRALDWSREGQLRRFVVLSRIGEFADRSVLDLGAGLGHFYEFLESRWPRVRYTGYDFSEQFVEEARRAHPNARFEVRDVLREPLRGTFDFVVSSGLHNLETGTNDADMTKLLRKAWSIAKAGIAFNMLSSRTKKRTNGRHYYRPERMLAAASKIAPCVTLEHNYMPHDFTIFLYKEWQK